MPLVHRKLSPPLQSTKKKKGREAEKQSQNKYEGFFFFFFFKLGEIKNRKKTFSGCSTDVFPNSLSFIVTNSSLAFQNTNCKITWEEYKVFAWEKWKEIHQWAFTAQESSLSTAQLTCGKIPNGSIFLITENYFEMKFIERTLKILPQHSISCKET